MAWVDLEYYKTDYLMGRKSEIPDSDFAFWEKQAETSINWRRVTIESPQEPLKRCVCEVAELLFRKAPKREVHGAIVKNLANTEYHNDFFYRGL